MAYPERVDKQSIHCVYLYEAGSERNKDEGQAKNVKHPGRTAEEGPLPPKDKNPSAVEAIAATESGVSSVLHDIGPNIPEHLGGVFPKKPIPFCLPTPPPCENCV